VRERVTVVRLRGIWEMPHAVNGEQEKNAEKCGT
jgi:hypothetical protein